MYYLKKFSTNSDVENLKMSGYTECPMVVASVENNISNVLYQPHGFMWNLPSSGNSQPFHGAYIEGKKFNLYLRDVSLSLPKIEPSETIYTIRWQMDHENNNLWATTSQNKQVIVKGRKQTQYTTEFRNRAFSFHAWNQESTTGYWLLKSVKISIKE